MRHSLAKACGSAFLNFLGKPNAIEASCSAGHRGVSNLLTQTIKWREAGWSLPPGLGKHHPSPLFSGAGAGRSYYNQSWGRRLVIASTEKS